MAAVLTTLFAGIGAATAQSIDPAFGGYSFSTLGPVDGGPISGETGTLTFKDSNTLLISSQGSNPGAQIYSFPVTRDGQSHITAIGTPTLFSTAPGPGPSAGGIDGGLGYGPGGVLFYTTYSDNGLGQIKPGSTAPDKLTSLTTLGIGSATLSVGSLGFDTAGHLKITSYGADTWYDTTLSADGSGTYNVTVGGSVALGSGFHPEGLAYVAAGAPQFASKSVLIASAAAAGKIYAYTVDANNDPVTSSQRLFMNVNDIGGMAVDPVSGDLLAITTNTGLIYDIKGFTPVPEPAAWTAMAAVACLVGAVFRRRLVKQSMAA